MIPEYDPLTEDSDEDSDLAGMFDVLDMIDASLDAILNRVHGRDLGYIVVGQTHNNRTVSLYQALGNARRNVSMVCDKLEKLTKG
jgi:hypothetical protein